VLSQAEIDAFATDGFVAVRGAVPADVLRLCQDEIWSALGEPGRARDVARAAAISYPMPVKTRCHHLRVSTCCQLNRRGRLVFQP
jgi:hypothetical protein